jgi:hypothetical protein
MFALVERYPNTDMIVFYLLASAILALALYRRHRKSGPSDA